MQIGQVYIARKDIEGRTINGQVDNTVHTGQATDPITCTNHCCYDGTLTIASLGEHNLDNEEAPFGGEVSGSLPNLRSQHGAPQQPSKLRKKLDHAWRCESETPRPSKYSTPEWVQVSRKNFEIPEKKVNITTRGRRTWPQGGVRVDVEPVQGTGNLSGLIAASWQDATASSSHDKGRMKLEFLFDSLATELRRASVANCTVTQDTVFVRFVGAAHIDRIAGESTGEPLQLRLPWDVWIAHATNQRKGRVYKTREGGVSRSHSAVVLVATIFNVVLSNSKQHEALAVLAGHRFLVADEDSTIRYFRQHAVRRHVAVSLGFISHDISASSPVGLANP